MEGTTSLLARAGFVTMYAGVLTLAGPPGQEAGIAEFADDFFVSVHVGSSPTPTSVWSKDHGGLPEFLGAILDRQFGGQGGRQLEDAD